MRSRSNIHVLQKTLPLRPPNTHSLTNFILHTCICINSAPFNLIFIQNYYFNVTFVFRQMPELHRTQYDFRDGEERGLHLTDSEQILQHSESFTTGQFLKEIRGYFKVYKVSYNTIVTFPRERFPAWNLCTYLPVLMMKYVFDNTIYWWPFIGSYFRNIFNSWLKPLK